MTMMLMMTTMASSIQQTILLLLLLRDIGGGSFLVADTAIGLQVAAFSTTIPIATTRHIPILVPTTSTSTYSYHQTARWRAYSSRFSSDTIRARSCGRCHTVLHNWIADLWDEVIEFSTYGPGERKMLKAKREAAASIAARESTTPSPSSLSSSINNNANADDDLSASAFAKVRKATIAQSLPTPQAASQEKISSSSIQNNQQLRQQQNQNDIAADTYDALSLDSFQRAVAASTAEDSSNTDDGPDIDGYGLRDALVEKWGIPLDIEFQRGYGGNSVYCTVLPVVFGSRKCRHATELDYLMHLQGVVEVLYEYKNLDAFLVNLETTLRTPKPGTDSVPFLLKLGSEELNKILGA